MSVSIEGFKDALANLVGGVVIVTTSTKDGLSSGMTATAVCAVSLDPPLVMVCMSHRAATHRAVERSGVFALNVLSAAALDIAERFASNRDDKFAGLATSVRASGAPILEEAIAYCDCEVETTVSAGDHTIFIGRVLDAASAGRGSHLPLLYFRGDYGSVALLDAAGGSSGSRDGGAVSEAEAGSGTARPQETLEDPAAP